MFKLFQRESLNLQYESPSLLASKEVVSLSNLWKGPFEVVVSGLWALFWAASLSDVVMSGTDLHKRLTRVSDPVSHLSPGYSKEVRNLILKSVSFVGFTANAASWADEIKAVALGGAALSVKSVGYGASCITNTAQAVKSCQEIFEQAECLSRSTSEAESVRLRQKQLLSSLDLSGYATAGVWAFLELIGLVLGIAFPAVLLTALMLLSFVLAVCALAYRIHLSNIYPKTVRA